VTGDQALTLVHDVVRDVTRDDPSIKAEVRAGGDQVEVTFERSGRAEHCTFILRGLDRTEQVEADVRYMMRLMLAEMRGVS
jgi:hypothetical protein